jgi:hypothetical protein
MTFPTEALAREFLAQMTPQQEANVVVVPTTHEHWAITSPREAKRRAKTCSICGGSFHEFPNNAQPINSGCCCAYCDDHVVTPARIALVTGVRR